MDTAYISNLITKTLNKVVIAPINGAVFHGWSHRYANDGSWYISRAFRHDGLSTIFRENEWELLTGKEVILISNMERIEEHERFIVDQVIDRVTNRPVDLEFTPKEVKPAEKTLSQLIAEAIMIKKSNKEFILDYCDYKGNTKEPWTADIGNSSEHVSLGECGQGECRGSGNTPEEAVTRLIEAINIKQNVAV